ncbi:MAG: peptidoglycan DD-metalloendopeptidase family protein [Fusobacteriaceae bacterium]
MIKLRFNFLIILIIIFSYSIEQLDIFNPEVVDLEKFTDYYAENVQDEEGESILSSNYFIIKRTYNFGNFFENKDTTTEIMEEVVTEVKIINYTIEKGDNLYDISKKYNVTEEILKANNPKLGKIIKIGDIIKIPSENGVFYKVKKGDSLFKIAQIYKVKSDSFKKYNKLVGNRLDIGQEIFIKDPNLKFITLKGREVVSKQGSNTSTQLAKAENFMLPIKFTGITSPYGNRFHPVLKRYIGHAGVDLRARYITAYASKEGKVKFAGTMNGYGKIIILSHANGYETRYAHLNKIYVSVGAKVNQGDKIAQTGNTGRSTGPHLHFEIRKNGKPINPMVVAKKR